MISTDVMISATIHRQLPTTGHLLPATSLTPPSAWCLKLSKSLDRAHSSSAIGSVLESMLGSVLESVLRTYLGAYSKAGWECAFECDWEHLESVLGNVQSSRLGVCH
jgi:ABC-type Mn2+/Zn2+ transport system permease subunit